MHRYPFHLLQTRHSLNSAHERGRDTSFDMFDVSYMRRYVTVLHATEYSYWLYTVVPGMIILFATVYIHKEVPIVCTK